MLSSTDGKTMTTKVMIDVIEHGGKVRVYGRDSDGKENFATAMMGIDEGGGYLTVSNVNMPIAG